MSDANQTIIRRFGWLLLALAAAYGLYTLVTRWQAHRQKQVQRRSETG